MTKQKRERKQQQQQQQQQRRRNVYNGYDREIEVPIDPRIKEKLDEPERPGHSHFDPLDKLPESDVQECREEARQKLELEHNRELSLAKNEIRVPNQEWALVSFIGGKCAQKADHLGLKIYGVFATPEEASAHAKRLNKSKEAEDFDIYVFEMYTWGLIPPDPDKIDDQHYAEDRLDKLIKEEKYQQYVNKAVFDRRKEKLCTNPDKNQYLKNKQVLSELAAKRNGVAAQLNANEGSPVVKAEGQGASATTASATATATDGASGAAEYEPNSKNSEVFKEVFPDQQKLPKFEVREMTKEEIEQERYQKGLSTYKMKL
jgi:hypothetical protein